MNPENIWITFPELLIWFPLLAGLVSFFTEDEKKVRAWSLTASIITLGIALTALCFTAEKYYALGNVAYEWMKFMGGSFSVGLDGMSRMLTLLTAVSFPLIFIATYRSKVEKPGIFHGLMLLTQAGLMGVFVAKDALVFYFFWELALIPVYFLCSKWGGEKRIAATFKFFVYTFTGSLLMLIGIIYVYLHTAGVYDRNTGALVSEHSFSLRAFQTVMLQPGQQDKAFWLFFIAFAIKMPVFPFHTWQPDTYEQSPTPVTMVLSGIMVKMGLFGVIRWILPMLPAAVLKFDHVVIGMSVIGMIYASLIAIKQNDLKRLVAYSSIAHIGLMCAAIFTNKQIGMEGVMLQMFNHGINIIGLWIVIEVLERQLGVRTISDLGGVAHKAPALTIMLVIIAFANIALPLTNAFAGELMMFSGLFKFSPWYTAFAGTSIILAAVYTLNMVQKVFYGDSNQNTISMEDISLNVKISLGIIVVLIFAFGVFPQPMLDLTKDTVMLIMGKH